MKRIAILNTGMVTGVGLNAPATCAAIRCALDNFQETRFKDSGGEWIIGSMVNLEEPWRGATKLAKMLSMALRECEMAQSGAKLENIPILICLAEKNRPGRFDDLELEVIGRTQKELGLSFHRQSAVFDQGRISIAAALQRSSELIHNQGFPNVIIAGVDSLLVSQGLSVFEKQARVLTSTNSDGFIPGEAAAAVLIGAVQPGDAPQLVVEGIGVGHENATIDSGIPLRGDGLGLAINSALAEAGRKMSKMDFRMTDISGGQYFFKEAALALARSLKEYKKGTFDIWNPADCIGEVGAAIGAVLLAVCLAAAKKKYALGNNVLCHLSNDDEHRAAIVLSYGTGGS